ncbi:MAG: sigma-70 family RNA polymerase sigma factor [Clostridia bacterium]|nr:sigma-70 family RNA polymerase sigma factor [Clostridia bacterium]
METVKGPDSMEKRIENMVTRYQLPLLRLCFAYLHDEELAKDAVQETFIKAFRSLDTFRESASEKTWLTRIAINTCKDMRRTSWFRHVDRTITPDMLPEPTAPVEPEDESLTIEIMKLPAKLKEVALLCWFQEMTYSEAAETLGISLQAVGSRLNRARRKLRFVMDGRDEREHS